MDPQFVDRIAAGYPHRIWPGAAVELARGARTPEEALRTALTPALR